MAVSFEDQPFVTAGDVPELNGPGPAGGECAAVRHERQAGRRLAKQREGADFRCRGDLPPAAGRSSPRECAAALRQRTRPPPTPFPHPPTPSPMKGEGEGDCLVEVPTSAEPARPPS